MNYVNTFQCFFTYEKVELIKYINIQTTVLKSEMMQLSGKNAISQHTT